MTSEKSTMLAETDPQGQEHHTGRAGQSDAPEGAAQTHILVITLSEKPGSVDRVVGLLRRRRANLRTLTIGRSEHPDVARITAVTDDSEVAVEQLIEQIRKVVDVQTVSKLVPQQMVERELALIKVTNEPQRSHELIELGQQFGAHIADIARDTVTLEVTGATANIEKLIRLLQPFGVREVARTGSVAMPRETEYTRA
jgi:acetolactate synthase-1/3 small subunit